MVGKASFCAECDHENRAGAAFCENCGFALEASDAAPDGASGRGGAGLDEPADRSGRVASEPEVASDVVPSEPTPEPPTTPAVQEVTIRIVRQPGIVWWGVAALGFAVFFPWLTTPSRINNAMGVPLEFLWRRSAPSDGLSLGWVLLGAAAVGAIASIASILAVVRRLAGLVAVVAAVSLVVQWVQVLDRINGTGHWLSYVGVGVYVAFVAGLLLLLAPSRARA